MFPLCLRLSRPETDLRKEVVIGWWSQLSDWSVRFVVDWWLHPLEARAPGRTSRRDLLKLNCSASLWPHLIDGEWLLSGVTSRSQINTAVRYICDHFIKILNLKICSRCAFQREKLGSHAWESGCKGKADKIGKDREKEVLPTKDGDAIATDSQRPEATYDVYAQGGPSPFLRR